MTLKKTLEVKGIEGLLDVMLIAKAGVVQSMIGMREALVLEDMTETLIVDDMTETLVVGDITETIVESMKVNEADMKDIG